MVRKSSAAVSDPTGRGSSAWVTAIRRRVFPAPTMKLLAMTMADYVNGDDECWPGNALLGAELGVTDRQVQALLAKLEALGVLRRGDPRKEKERRGRPRRVWVFSYEGLSRLPIATRPLPEDVSGKSDEIPEVPESITGSEQAELPEVEQIAPSFRNPPVEEPPKRTPATPSRRRIPDDFVVSDGMLAWAQEHAPLVNVYRATDSFVDYWRGEGKAKSDWPSTWRNWMRRKQEDAEQQRPNARPNGHRPTTTVERSWQNIKATEHLS